jgi:transposase
MYSEEFRRDVVELYRSTPGVTVVGIVGDLGMMDSTSSAWRKAAGVPVGASGSRGPTVRPPGGETADQKPARLPSRVRELEAERREFGTEWEILHVERVLPVGGVNAPDHDTNGAKPLVIDVDATLVTAHSPGMGSRDRRSPNDSSAKWGWKTIP